MVEPDVIISVRRNVMMSDRCMRIDYEDLEADGAVNTVNSARLAVNGGLAHAQSKPRERHHR